MHRDRTVVGAYMSLVGAESDRFFAFTHPSKHQYVFVDKQSPAFERYIGKSWTKETINRMIDECDCVIINVV